MKANLVFKNGCVYTADKKRTMAEALPDYSVEEYKEGLLVFQDMAHQYGFTGAYDAKLVCGSNAIEALKELDKENKLSMYMRGAY